MARITYTDADDWRHQVAAIIEAVEAAQAQPTPIGWLPLNEETAQVLAALRNAYHTLDVMEGLIDSATMEEDEEEG